MVTSDCGCKEYFETPDEEPEKKKPWPFDPIYIQPMPHAAMHAPFHPPMVERPASVALPNPEPQPPPQPGYPIVAFPQPIVAGIQAQPAPIAFPPPVYQPQQIQPVQQIQPIQQFQPMQLPATIRLPPTGPPMLNIPGIAPPGGAGPALGGGLQPGILPPGVAPPALGGGQPPAINMPGGGVHQQHQQQQPGMMFQGLGQGPPNIAMPAMGPPPVGPPPVGGVMPVLGQPPIHPPGMAPGQPVLMPPMNQGGIGTLQNMAMQQV